MRIKVELSEETKEAMRELLRANGCSEEYIEEVIKRCSYIEVVLTS